MNWIQRNFKTIIYFAFLVPILTVAFVSISHVTTWYGLSNPISWAIYLSFGIEIAALAALAAISAKMGGKVYVPFGIVTLIQFIGNIFFAYQYIDINSEQFKDWVELTDPVVSYLGVESGNTIGHKRFLSLFSGGLLPIISLSFLHMLVKYEEEDKKSGNTDTSEVPPVVPANNTSDLPGGYETNFEPYVPTQDELSRFEAYLNEINKKKFGENNENLANVDSELQINKTEEEQTSVESPEAPINEESIGQTKEEQTSVESPEAPINEDNVGQTEPVLEEAPIVESEANNENLDFNVIFKEVVEDDTTTENNNMEESTITVEPDFYVEDEPDYHIDEPIKAKNNVRRLSYFRPH